MGYFVPDQILIQFTAEIQSSYSSTSGPHVLSTLCTMGQGRKRVVATEEKYKSLNWLSC